MLKYQRLVNLINWYLNSLLEGPEYKTIQGLTLTDSSYNTAVATFKECFGNTQQIINAHMEAFLKVANCTGDWPALL